MAIYTFLQVLRFRYNNIKPIEKLSRRHFINSFDVSEVLGLTVLYFPGINVTSFLLNSHSTLADTPILRLLTQHIRDIYIIY